MRTQSYDETIKDRVSLHPFLAGMNQVQLALLADCAIAVRFQPGEVILREGARADRFLLIETGDVLLESNEAPMAPVVDRIGAGDLLGWSWMFPPYTWQFSARAASATQALMFFSCVLRQYCERDHSLGYELLKRMTATMNRRLQKARRAAVSAGPNAHGLAAPGQTAFGAPFKTPASALSRAS